MEKSKSKKCPKDFKKTSMFSSFDSKKKGNTGRRITLDETLIHSSKRQRNKDFVNYIKSEFHNMETRTIENVLIYAQQLPIYGSLHIDELIFESQMFRHFDITDKFMVSRMFTMTSHFRKTMSVLEYCILICTFISDEPRHRTNYAFNIYNFNGDGFLTKSDLRYMLTPAIKRVHMNNHEDEEDEEENINYLTEIVLKMIDRDGSASIDREEFAQVVKHNSLMLECLGPCLPSNHHLTNFKDKILNKENFEIMAMFRNERRDSLRVPISNVIKQGIQQYYPVMLEFRD